MLINKLLKEQNMTKYRLSKDSGVPQATINDICSGKADLEKCATGTLYRIAKVLGVTVEDILHSVYPNTAEAQKIGIAKGKIVCTDSVNLHDDEVNALFFTEDI